jgi:hypothetical protein
MRKTLARIHGAVETVTHLLELLEPSRQSIPIRAIFTSRQLDQLPNDPLQAKFEKRAIMRCRSHHHGCRRAVGTARDPERLTVKRSSIMRPSMLT